MAVATAEVEDHSLGVVSGQAGINSAAYQTLVVPLQKGGNSAPPSRCDAKGFKPEGGKPLLYLYVWAGVSEAVGASAASTAQPKDFVATIDVTEGSPCFGQIISEADVPTSGNEPHHVGLNQNATVSSPVTPNLLGIAAL
jgi:hypothetical protein